MKNILSFIFALAVAILFVDFLAFVGWVASGQVPVDNFYIGSITAHILKAILL